MAAPSTDTRDRPRIVRVVLVILGLAAAVPLVAVADEVILKSGGQISGRIVSQSATDIQMDVGAGRIGIPVSSVARVDKGQSPLQVYEDRAGRLAPGDVEGWLALGAWASSGGLGTQAREAYSRAHNASPADPRANAALGNVQIDGRWVSEEEGYRARGYVQFEGEWMTAAEEQAIQRERAQAQAYEKATRDARQAEAKAKEAEARARQAEAKATEVPELTGIPMWYGWGAGPNTWSSGPILAPPPTVKK
jgi:hypothetical protein